MRGDFRYLPIAVLSLGLASCADELPVEGRWVVDDSELRHTLELVRTSQRGMVGVWRVTAEGLRLDVTATRRLQGMYLDPEVRLRLVGSEWSYLGRFDGTTLEIRPEGESFPGLTRERLVFRRVPER